MRRVIMAAFALVVAAGGLAAQDKMTTQERQQLEKQLQDMRDQMRDLQTKMRDLQRKLGQESNILVGPRLRLFGDSLLVRSDSMTWDTPLTISIETDRPRLGVVVKTVPDPATDSIGAVLQAITPDGPAAEAGLLAGDIVVTFNGVTLRRSGKVETSPGDHLIELAHDLKEGDSVQVKYLRGSATKTTVIVPRKLDSSSYSYSYVMPDYGRALDLTRERLQSLRRSQEDAQGALVERMKMQGDSLRGAIANVYTLQFGSRWSDMELTTLDSALGGYFGTNDGLLVVRAPKDTLLGLRSGDVILRIGGRVPATPSQAIRILRSYEPGDEIRLDIMRNKRRTEVTATVPQRDRGLFWDDRTE
jgi:C-terminal processing protease CtpA/Prc